MVRVKCPNCDEQFQVVIPEEMKEQPTRTTTEESETSLQGRIVSWEMKDPALPYYGDEKVHPNIEDIEQQIRAEVRINGHTTTVTVWYTPHTENWENTFKYVVRGQTDAGQKSLNVNDGPDGLYVKNRATPWIDDQNWTYLSQDQLGRRSQIAGLGDVIEDDGEGGYGILLDLEEQPPVVDEELTDDFVITLTKALLVMKSRENPAV